MTLFTEIADAIRLHALATVYSTAYKAQQEARIHAGSGMHCNDSAKDAVTNFSGIPRVREILTGGRNETQ